MDVRGRLGFWGLFLVIAAVIGLAASAVAETPEYEEDEVVVTAAPLQPPPEPQTLGMTEVITGPEVKQSGPDNVAATLAADGQPVAQSGGSAPANLRLDGTEAGQTAVLINGMPLDDGAGRFDLAEYPTVGVKEIAISHGPFAVGNGADALGGVANIVSDLTGGAESQNQVSFGGGSFGSSRLNLAVSQDRWGFAAGLHDSDGDRQRSGVSGGYFLGQYDFIQADQEYLRLYLQAFRKKAEVPGSEIAPKNDAEQLAEDYAIHLSGKRLWTDTTLEYNLYGQRWNQHYDEPGEHDRYHGTGLGGDATGMYQWGDHAFQAGVSLKQSDLNGANGDHDQNAAALYAQDTYRMNSSFQWVGGLRQDWNSRDDSPLLPRLGLIQTVNDRLTVKYGYGKVFRAPSLAELYLDQPLSGITSNPNLQAERGDRFDITAEYRQDQDRSVWQFNLFHNRLTDGISWVPLDLSQLAAGYKLTNFARTRTDGFSVGWQRRWLDRLSSRADYHWLSREDRGTDGAYRTNNFLGRNQFGLGLTFSQAQWDADLAWRLVWDRISVGVELPDYQLVDLNFHYRYNTKLSFSIGCTNLTDEHYAIQAGYPMPGRAFQLTMDYLF